MRLIDADALKNALNYIYDCAYIESKSKEGIASDIIAEIDNAPTVEGRMFYVQETVNTILNSCTGNTDIDKAFRNAARLVQNAIDGKSVDFEEIERSDEE